MYYGHHETAAENFVSLRSTNGAVVEGRKRKLIGERNHCTCIISHLIALYEQASNNCLVLKAFDQNVKFSFTLITVKLCPNKKKKRHVGKSHGKKDK